MAKTPEESALAAVTKAIQDHEKASDKLVAAREKFDAAASAEHRAARTVTWAASHPDLPDDFDLDTFREQLAAPFDEELEQEAEEISNAITSGEIDPDQLEVPDDASSLDEEDDDPFGDEEPVAPAKSRGRR